MEKKKKKKNTYTLLFPFDHHFSVSFFFDLFLNFSHHVLVFISFFRNLPLADCRNNNIQTSLFFYPLLLCGVSFVNLSRCHPFNKLKRNIL